MIDAIIPKLPMRNKAITKAYYLKNLGFVEFGRTDVDYYLMLERNKLQLHFFEFKDLNPFENYGQVYLRTTAIEKLYQALLHKNVPIHPNGKLESKPWGQKEFSLLDPDHNLLTFGQPI
ncbi:bleomycin resistance protein [Maribacter sp. X9]|uniref:bleomycin resistance protein n=1 Tax=Maribacter sp. X9 TaxID=3402159 RepID=UPI003AF3FF43